MPLIDYNVDSDSAIREHLYKLTFENAAVGIAQLNQEGRFIKVNKKFSEITGYANEELLQKTFHKITYPDDLDDDLEQADALMRGKISSYTLEKRYIRKEGTIVWVKLTGSAVFNDHGGFEMYVGVIEDITEKKQTEEELHKSLQHFKIASAAANIGSYFRNLKTGEDYWSPEMMKIFGLKATDSFVLKDGIPEAVHPDDRDGALQQVNQYFNQVENNEFNRDHRIILPDGTIRWVNVRGVTEYDSSANPVKIFGIVMDITERKQAEEALLENEANFRILANNMSQLAWMMDSNGWVYWFNKRWYDYTGTTFEEMQGWGWQKVHHPDHINKVIESKKLSIETGKVWEEIFPIRNKEISLVSYTCHTCKE